MTAILAIDFKYQIIILADCRVTWNSNPRRFQDNLQKLYPLGPTGVIGFAGDTGAAKRIFQYVTSQPKKPLPSSAKIIAEEIGHLARDAYEDFSYPGYQPQIKLMYAAADYGNVTLVAPNVVFAENILVQYESPDFIPSKKVEFIQLGYAIRYPGDLLLENRDGLLGYGLQPHDRKFQVGVAVGHFGSALAALGETKVGGLFTIGIITSKGVNWFYYSVGEGLELRIEEGQFVQYDHKDGRRVPLKAIWDFDPYRPDAGNLIFETPN